MAAAAVAAAAAAVDEPRVRVGRVRDACWSVSAPSPTLDGNVPLRAAQACAPFVEGNGAGVSFRPPRPLVLARSGRRWLARDPYVTLTESRGGLRLRVDTGLWVEPVGGALEVERAFNRADRRVAVSAQRIASRQGLVLELALAIEPGVDELVLDGVLASGMLVAPAVRWAGAGLEAGREMIARHRDFFDRSYFSEKREGATKRYRERSREGAPSLVDPDVCDAVALSLTSAAALAGDALALRAECAIHAENYGSITRCVLAPSALARRTSALRSAMASYATMDEDDPAFLYFAHYAMAHTHGDPRVLVKPAVLVATREDWVLVVDGPRAESLRGVCEGQWFHAVPVVMDVFTRLSHAAGAPLGRVRAMPRAMVHPAIEWCEG